MTPADLARYVRKMTRTNATTYSDADLAADACIHMDDIALAIEKIRKGYFGGDYLFNLVAGQRAYPFDANMLGNGLKSVEAQIDGVNWKKLDPTDFNSLDIASDEASITSYFACKKSAYEIWMKKLWILSQTAILNVTGGLKIRCSVYPYHLVAADMTGTTDMSVDHTVTGPSVVVTPGFPRALHELLARRLIMGWKESQPKPIPFSTKEQAYDIDLERAIRLLRSPNQDEAIIAVQPYNDGSQY